MTVSIGAILLAMYDECDRCGDDAQVFGSDTYPRVLQERLPPRATTATAAKVPRRPGRLCARCVDEWEIGQRARTRATNLPTFGGAHE